MLYMNIQNNELFEFIGDTCYAGNPCAYVKNQAWSYTVNSEYFNKYYIYIGEI